MKGDEEKARAAGCRIWLDADVKCGHLTPTVIGEQHFRLWQQQGVFDSTPGRAILADTPA